MFQLFFEGFGYTLLEIVNSSLATGSVPAEWKHALVTPIPKGKVSSKPADTRPISLLPAIMKVVERIVQKQLINYLETNHLLTNTQHGYRRCHSTESAIAVVTDIAYRAMDCGEITILVLTDLTKCFDVVPHGMLLDKLTLCGIDNVWFQNYLKNHTQQVQVRTATGGVMLSESKSNNIGVFQGGSLSCVLYMIFVNDMSLHMPDDVTIVQYADDAQLLISGKKRDLPRLVERMQNALRRLHQWLCHHGMKLNTTKTQMLVLGTPGMLKTLPPVTIDFCGATVPNSKFVKNLGSTIEKRSTLASTSKLT